MKNWVKSLLNLLKAEENSNKQEQAFTDKIHAPSAQSKTKPRMVYQYPQVKFRFPVIPDEPKPLKEQSVTNFRKQQVPKVPSPKFKPSVVPSPIYGLTGKSANRRDMNREQVAQYSDVTDGVAKENLIANTEEMSQRDRIISVKDNAHTFTDQVIPDNPVVPKAKAGPQITAEPNKPSAIPFNVLMLNQDKHKVLPKNEQVANKPSQSAQFATGKPPVDLLNVYQKTQQKDDEWLAAQTNLLNETLANFNVKAKVVHATQGPSVTRFEIQPQPGVKVNKITNLTDDIKLSLSAKDIRIEAPIPGKNTVGIEVPNRLSEPVFIREIISHESFKQSHSPLTVALGLDIEGTPVITDVKKMPHGLIAGATGSGKSVCINTIIISLLYKADPDEVRLLLIDPKMVELAPFHGLPHLVSPVITDVKAATAALKWVVAEMESRYEQFALAGVRDIDRYNQKEKASPPLPHLVIVIDELADLMMTSPQEVEDAICRIAQKARACGIHLLVATQRPSVDVITGLIKANIPTRIAFSVSSQVDSRTIIDTNGAERLLGKGDMLLLENGSSKPIRVQGCFVSDDEIDEITAYLKANGKPNYLFDHEELLGNASFTHEEDELFVSACELIFEQDAASASSLQRKFHIGYNRAARLIDMMEEQGIISSANGSKPREVLISKDTFRQMRSKATSESNIL